MQPSPLMRRVSEEGNEPESFPPASSNPTLLCRSLPHDKTPGLPNAADGARPAPRTVRVQRRLGGVSANAIALERVVQDGMRVRAAAGTASFRRQARLQGHLDEVSELAQTLKMP